MEKFTATAKCIFEPDEIVFVDLVSRLRTTCEGFAGLCDAELTVLHRRAMRVANRHRDGSHVRFRSAAAPVADITLELVGQQRDLQAGATSSVDIDTVTALYDACQRFYAESLTGHGSPRLIPRRNVDDPRQRWNGSAWRRREHDLADDLADDRAAWLAEYQGMTPAELDALPVIR